MATEGVEALAEEKPRLLKLSMLKRTLQKHHITLGTQIKFSFYAFYASMTPLPLYRNVCFHLLLYIFDHDDFPSSVYRPHKIENSLLFFLNSWLSAHVRAIRFLPRKIQGIFSKNNSCYSVKVLIRPGHFEVEKVELVQVDFFL